MQEGQVAREDPRRGARVAIVALAALLLAASGVFAATIALHPDGTHGAVVDAHPLRLVVFLVLAGAAIAVASNPHKPDVRVAQAVLLACAVVAVVVGLAGILEPRGAPGVAAGVAPYLQLGGALIFLVARWTRGLWPSTQWKLPTGNPAPGRS